jgi:formylglycine-generating enzyme required for sulfatase activity
MKISNQLSLFTVALCCLQLPAQAAGESAVTLSPKATKASKPDKPFRDCVGCPRMVVIHGGSFVMGSPDVNAPSSETGRGEDESPQHKVKIASFVLGQTEVTRGQFAKFVKQTKYRAGEKCWTLSEGTFEERDGLNWRAPGFAQKDTHPVTCISWNDAAAYVKWLSRITKKNYRLPTESEWEFAARGGTTTARFWGEKAEEACAFANGADKTAQKVIVGASSWTVHDCEDGFVFTAPVASFKTNDVGLHDMLGNVWEWTVESYHPNYINAPTDGSIWQGDAEKIALRGGSWNNGPRDLRAAVRNPNKPDLRFNIFGFRVARDIR